MQMEISRVRLAVPGNTAQIQQLVICAKWQHLVQMTEVAFFARGTIVRVWEGPVFRFAYIL